MIAFPNLHFWQPSSELASYMHVIYREYIANSYIASYIYVYACMHACMHACMDDSCKL